MRKLLTLFLLLPFIVFSQQDYIDPLGTNINEAMKLNLKSIECTSTTHNKYGDGSEEIVERLFFEKNGQSEVYENARYYDSVLTELETHTTKYTFRNDTVIQEDLEVLTQGVISIKELIYDGDLLVETNEERVMRDRPFKTVYQYLPNSKLDKKFYAVYGDPYIQYTYDGDLLVAESYHPGEGDPATNTTSYRYSPKGILIEKLKVSHETGDTIAWAKYNESGKLVRLQHIKKDDQNGYGYEQNLMHWELFEYDDNGLLKKKRIAVESYTPPKEGEFFKEMFYHYEGDKLMRIDSVDAVKHFQYNDQELLAQVISQNKEKNTDTIAIETFEYDENGLVLEYTIVDYMKEQGYKWAYTYSNQQKTSEIFYLLGVEKKCSHTITYDFDKNLEYRIQFCPINERNLPADVPFDIKEIYFDQEDRVISSVDKYANHDGSIHIARKDSFVLSNVGIEKMIATQYRAGKERRKTIGHYNYDKEGVLKRIYSVVESDTIMYFDYEFEDGIEVLKTQYGYGKIWDGTPRGKEIETKYHPEERYTLITVFHLDGRVSAAKRIDYNENKLPIKYSVTRGSNEDRKTYKYTYYD